MKYYIVLYILIQTSCRNRCYCSGLNDGVSDSIKGAIQLLTGLNELLSTGKEVSPLSLANVLAEALNNNTNGSNVLTSLERFYEQFFAPSNLTESENREDGIPDNTTMSPLKTDHEEEKERYLTAFDEYVNSAVATSEPPTTKRIDTTTETNKVSIQFATDGTVIAEEILYTPENSTFEKFLAFQDNMCYKLKGGIESITHSDLVVLFMKFLEYEYLKAKESWERIKVTTSKIWETTIDASKENGQMANMARVVDQTKNQVRDSLNVLKSPFSAVVEGITNKFSSTPEYQEDHRDFCEKFNDAERRMNTMITDLEKKFNNKLDVEIEKEKEILEKGKNDPDKLILFNKEAIVKDINFIKDKLSSIYEYIKITAINHLFRLQANR